MSTIRPPALQPGDAVMLVSPSGPTSPERVTRGTELLTGWGLSVQLGADVYAQHGFFGGTDAQRLAGFNAALRDRSVRAVICTRGGYGAQRIVDGLDLDAVRADPKLVVGFSDITAIQLTLWRGARLATVHGPGAAWMDDRTPQASAGSLRDALTTVQDITLKADPDAETGSVHTEGTGHGILLGGNLCVLVATLGTQDFPDLDGAILLL